MIAFEKRKRKKKKKKKEKRGEITHLQRPFQPLRFRIDALQQ